MGSSLTAVETVPVIPTCTVCGPSGAPLLTLKTAAQWHEFALV
jgi:hypothetical protein